MATCFSPLNTVFKIGRISGLINKSACFLDATTLHELELIYIEKANHKRRQEFITGRYCARQALAELGARAEVILRDEHRAPVWPANVVGSISHSGRLCGAIVASRQSYLGIGLDIEKRKVLKPAVAGYVCTEEELAYIKETGNPELAVLFFSIKEAIYKCLVQATEYRLNFKDVSIKLTGDDSFEIDFHNHPIEAERLQGCYRFGTHYIYSIVTYR